MAAAASRERPVGGTPAPSGADGAAARSTGEPILAGLLDALDELARGDFGVRLPTRRAGLPGEVARAFNAVAEQNARFGKELTRIARVVGRDGKMGERVSMGPVEGAWASSAAAVNGLIDDLARPTTEVARVLSAVAQGDLSQQMALNIDGQPVKGEFQRIGKVVNSMVAQLSRFADEVTRVAREVGTEGNLGGQANVRGVAGTWKDLTDSVNLMASNLTDQVRDIAQVTTAVAKGDLSQKISVDVRGELLELKQTINTMVDQLSSFAGEVTRVAREVGTEGRLGGQAEVPGVSGTWEDLTQSVNHLAANLTTQVRAIAEVSNAVTQGDLTRLITVAAPGEVGELKDTINEMIVNLRETTRRNEEQDWLKSNLARISAQLQGHRDLQAVARLIMSELTRLVSAQHGAFFVAESEDGRTVYRLIAAYGVTPGDGLAGSYELGESLVGQAAVERASIVVTDAPPDYIRISSGLGQAAPASIVILPVLFEDQVLAVIELASFRPFSPVFRAFLEQIVETVGVVISTITANMRTEELLEESQRLTHELQSQSEELQAQQDELRRSNHELGEQARSLRASEELLQTQQEELQQTNAELEEKATQLAEQNQAIEVKNREIELARQALEERAEQLALSSRYKSEFLANMSHELRTPLNSLLILAKLLSDNPHGNLNAKQVEFARSIHGAGSDLLDLISDILDLSKVEAGKMDVSPASVDLRALERDMAQIFRPLADQKGLTFTVELSDDTPPTFVTDEQRLQQILKNLLSNALKFTDEGSVVLRIESVPVGQQFLPSTLNRADRVVAFRVTDTGIGIAEDKQMLIFEAFQQADGSTSRRYGGTGLGLSISREIARLLGGEIQVTSAPEVGSTFTLFLPEVEKPAVPADQPPAAAPPAPLTADLAPVTPHAPAPAPAEEPDDDRADIQPADRVLLVISGEADMARTAAGLGRERGFKVLLAARGDRGLQLAREHRPDAIVLDTQLPGIDGLAILEELKRLPETRHIPVHIISTGDQRQIALSAGAIAYLEKPVPTDLLADALTNLVQFIETSVRRLLVVEDDERERNSIVELVGGDSDLDIVAVGTSADAMAALEKGRFDCMVLDLKLPQTSGFRLLEQVKADARFTDMPVIVYTGRDLTRREETRLKKYAETIIVKDVRSPDRLLDETALFLHRVESRMPAEKRRMIEQLHTADAIFQGKSVLIVDDDVRNVFALTSAFEGRGMEVAFAENGREGLEALERRTDVDLVLMDIMMPEMDGHEAMRAIRADERFKRLPIIALTAKAMKGDRENSIAAGASDYITKPVDIDQLLSLMRVWLYR